MTIQRNRLAVTRRDCLKLGLGGGLAHTLRLKAKASGASAVAARSCILIWMDGGPTHYETFDPKPNAPSEIRGTFQPIQTRTPGVLFSQHMERLAGISDKLAVVRSIRHEQGNHGAGNHYMMTGAPPRIPVGCGAFVSFHPSLGSVTAHERGAPHGLPAYFSMPSMSRSGGPNFLGARYAPFVVDDNPNNPEFRVRDVALPRGLSEGRFDARREIRSEVDRMARILDQEAGDPVNALDQHYVQAADLMRSREAQAAFDIQREPDRVRDAYGRNPFGQRALLARRLVEAGVPFITLYDGGWDHHVAVFDKCAERLPGWDATVAALISDLDQRGLLDSTLVIALGEFGRDADDQPRRRPRPLVELDVGAVRGGRHSGNQAVSACGVRRLRPRWPRTHSPENFASTVYLKLGIDPSKILYTPQGRPTHLVSATGADCSV